MQKDIDAFRTISEVAQDLDLPQHVLRFWETRFRQIKPMKRGGGRRYYRPDDVELLRGIKGLLYDEGYTIRGVQRLLKEHGNRLAIEFGRTGQLNLEIPAEAALSPVGEAGPGQVAVTGDAEGDAARDRKSAGIIGRLTSRVSQAGGASEDTKPLARSDVETLKSTLHELLECKRLLDQTRQN